MDNLLKQNKFETFEEVSNGLLAFLAPLREELPKRSGHLKLGTHGTTYTEDTRQAEGFLRLFWGIAPFLTQQDDDALRELMIQGLIDGCNPASSEYFGVPNDYDQLLVETASIATTFLLAKEKTWDRFSEDEKENISSWLLQINDRDMPKNNWYFFRILVNISMKKMGMRYSQEQIDSDFKLIESFYKGNGWYYDGEETQLDYYIPWGFQFYSLLYAKFMEKEDPKRSQLFKERAKEFSQSYRYWFDKEGHAIPFGRSLTYRFAQSAFWSALVFADVEALPWGEIKGLFSRNMHAWCQQDIFTEKGYLNVGYYYQNLNMAEGYNAPGSTYWALKSFLLLATPKDHPYWQAEVQGLNVDNSRIVLEDMRSLIEHTKDSKQVLSYPFGQFVGNQNHSCAKYSKFVYSTLFGFSIPKSDYYYYEGGYDNVLCVSEDETHFRAKALDTSFQVTEDWVTHTWHPMKEVEIHSTIVPFGNAHVRIHEIRTNRDIICYDGSFSALYDVEGKVETQDFASYTSSIGKVLAQNIQGFESASVIRPEPNTNLLYSRSLLPTLKVKLSSGKHVLISVMAGIPTGEEEILPIVSVQGNQVVMSCEEVEVRFELKH